MEIVVKIDLGFGKRDVRWYDRAFLEKGRITRAAGRGFDRRPGDHFDSGKCSWRSTTLGRGPEYEAKYEQLVRQAGEHGHYYDGAITPWLESDDADTLVQQP